MIVLGILTLLMLFGAVYFGRKMYKISEKNKARIAEETQKLEEKND